MGRTQLYARDHLRLRTSECLFCRILGSNPCTESEADFPLCSEFQSGIRENRYAETYAVGSIAIGESFKATYAKMDHAAKTWTAAH